MHLVMLAYANLNSVAGSPRPSSTTTTTSTSPSRSVTSFTTTTSTSTVSVPPITTISSTTPIQPTTTSSSPIVVSTTSTSTINLSPTVLPPPSLSTTPASGGSVLSQTPTAVTFPTIHYTGQSLLTGTCIIPQYTLVQQPDGSLLELPIIGCCDNRPDCCPSLNPVLVTPQSTSTTTVVQLVTAQTVVASALSADPLTICPADYSEIGSVCCPAYVSSCFQYMNANTYEESAGSLCTVRHFLDKKLHATPFCLQTYQFLARCLRKSVN